MAAMAGAMRTVPAGVKVQVMPQTQLMAHAAEEEEQTENDNDAACGDGLSDGNHSSVEDDDAMLGSILGAHMPNQKEKKNLVRLRAKRRPRPKRRAHQSRARQSRARQSRARQSRARNAMHRHRRFPVAMVVAV
jgi:hypothetical protein